MKIKVLAAIFEKVDSIISSRKIIKKVPLGYIKSDIINIINVKPRMLFSLLSSLELHKFNDRFHFSSSQTVSSTNKSYHHDIAEILLKVALNTITQTPVKPNNLPKLRYSSIAYVETVTLTAGNC